MRKEVLNVSVFVSSASGEPTYLLRRMVRPSTQDSEIEVGVYKILEGVEEYGVDDDPVFTFTMKCDGRFNVHFREMLHFCSKDELEEFRQLLMLCHAMASVPFDAKGIQ